MRCARCNNTHEDERHNCGNTIPAHDELTPFRVTLPFVWKA